MKTILFPTDFSKNAQHASEYAGMLAKVFDAQIVLLNVHFIPMVAQNHPSSKVQAAININKNEAIDELAAFTKDFIERSGIDSKKTSQRVEYGFPAEKIVEIAEEINADFIVMGTKGASAILDKWLGTNAQKVMQSAPCPVWIIPESTIIETPKKLMYAADFKEDEVTATKKFVQIIRPLDSLCKVIHVHDIFEPAELDTIKETVGALRNELKGEDVLVRNFNRTDIIEGLETYIDTYKPDLLALAVHEKSFMEKLFNTSVTKHFVQEAQLPILTFRK